MNAEQKLERCKIQNLDDNSIRQKVIHTNISVKFEKPISNVLIQK